MPREVALADVDRDGDLDIVTLNDQDPYEPSALSVFYNDGHGQLAEELVWATNFVGHLTIGDLNGDGWPDLAMSGINAGGGENMVYMLLNNGAGRYGTSHIDIGGLNNGEWDGYFGRPTLSRKLDMGKAYVWRGALGDVDRDGDIDLLVLDSWGKLQARRNQGNATFGDLYPLPSRLAYHPELAVGDIDGDGWLEWLLPRLAAAGPRRPAATGDRALLTKLR